MSLNNTGPQPGNCQRRVRVSSVANAAVRDESNAGFVIAASAPVTAIALGDTWKYQDTGVVNLSRKGESAAQWQFQLAGQPLTAVVTFEVLNADLAAPPVVSANDGPGGFASVHWPDLSDPGFRGESRPLEPAMRFQFTGWVRAQFVIPGNLLHALDSPGGQRLIEGPLDDSGMLGRIGEL